MAHSPPSHLCASGGHCGPTFFSLVSCVLLFDHPTSSIVVLPTVSPLVIAIALAIIIAIASPHQHIKALASVDVNTLTSSLLPFPSSHAILLAQGHGLSPPSRHLCTLLLGLTSLAPQTIPASVICLLCRPVLFPLGTSVPLLAAFVPSDLAHSVSLSSPKSPKLGPGQKLKQLSHRKVLTKTNNIGNTPGFHGPAS